MAHQKETFMVLKVDLECDRCYTKVKRILCQFPQIRDQIYREKENAVMIKVVCCSPDKIKDKLCAKGGKSIKTIEILEPKKPPVVGKQGDKTNEAPPADKQKQAATADNKQPPQAAGKPKKKVTFKLDEQPAKAKPAQQAAMMAPMVSAPVYGYRYPVNGGCLECYEGRMCGYHNNGYGVPPPPPPAGGYGYGVPPPPPPAYYYKPGYGDYVSDENVSGCVVM